MSERNDNDFVEQLSVSFAIYCDENGLTLDEGRNLADRIGSELESSADDRAAYLPDA